MSYFSTEEVDNLKSLRAMVTEDLINEMPLHSHSFSRGVRLVVAAKRMIASFIPTLDFAPKPCLLWLD